MKVLKTGHAYKLAGSEGPGGDQSLRFVEKEEKDGKLELVKDGTTNEEVLMALIDRLRFLNTKVPDLRNEYAIENLAAALTWLQSRTADRMTRGVEGTNKA
jgi:hypothetical protein